MTGSAVALVSADLMFISRVRAALGGRPLAVVGDEDMPDAGTVFVDLNSSVEHRLAVIAALRARGGAQIIGFCNHEDRDVRVRAMESGADQVVTNGSLPEATVRLIPSVPGGPGSADG